MIWVWVFVGVGVMLWQIARDNSRRALQKASGPYPFDKYGDLDDFGVRQFPVLSSSAGAWTDLEKWRAIYAGLESFGFGGFESYEEVEGGGADLLEPDEQLAASEALLRLKEKADRAGWVTVSGERVHVNEIEQLRTILRGGRCVRCG